MDVKIIFGVLNFIFGLVIGSFLNVVIMRLETGEPFWQGRSHCPHCKHQLAWFDLIPIFSFFLLKGVCRYCQKKISWQYPLVELTTALIFLGIFNFQFSIFNQFEIFQFLNLLLLFYIAGSLIVIFVYDFKFYLIPDNVLFPAIGATFLYRLLEGSSSLPSYVLAAVLASGFFLAIYLLSKGVWMGFGDVKLAILMGLLLGIPNIFLALFLAFLLGAIIGVAGIALKKTGLKSEVPFAPFLIVGTAIAFFWGNQIITWYLHLFLI